MPTKFTAFAALMQADVESTPVYMQEPQPADIFGGKGKMIAT